MLAKRGRGRYVLAAALLILEALGRPARSPGPVITTPWTGPRSQGDAVRPRVVAPPGLASALTVGIAAELQSDVERVRPRPALAGDFARNMSRAYARQTERLRRPAASARSPF
jgi:hypothetical protein